MPALFLRGLLLNFILIVPLVMVAAGLFVLLVKRDPALELMFRDFYFTTVLIVLLAAALHCSRFSSECSVLRADRRNMGLTDKVTRILGLYLGVVVLIAFVELQPMCSMGIATSPSTGWVRPTRNLGTGHLAISQEQR